MDVIISVMPKILSRSLRQRMRDDRIIPINNSNSDLLIVLNEQRIIRYISRVILFSRWLHTFYKYVFEKVCQIHFLKLFILLVTAQRYMIDGLKTSLHMKDVITDVFFVTHTCVIAVTR